MVAVIFDDLNLLKYDKTWLPSIPLTSIDIHLSEINFPWIPIIVFKSSNHHLRYPSKFYLKKILFCYLASNS